MAKINLNDLASLNNKPAAISLINQNAATIETKSDTFLSRDGVTPNHMEADLDMNSNRILNLPEPATDNEPVRLQDLTGIVGGSGGSPVNASYLTLSANGVLTNERVLTAGTGITFTDTGANGTLTIDSTVTPGGGSTDIFGLNVQDFGAVPDNNTDSVPGIQAAIDAAFAAGTPAVYVPIGVYKCYSRPIFMDPPGNMRGADGTNGVTYNGGTSYSINNTVNFNSIPYISLQNSNVGHQPDTSPTFWRLFNWDSATTYASGDIVRHGGVPWKSRQGSNTNHNPLDFNSAWWEPWYIQPTRFDFSMRFYGLHGGNHEGANSSRLNCNDANVLSIALIVGPGQGMLVDHLTIFKANPSVTRKAMKGWGIAVAGGPGGATRTSIEHCHVESTSVGIIVGFNQDSLGDSNLVYKTNVWECYIGMQISQTQNFINNIVDCSFSNTIGIQAINGQSYNVYGGNFSRSAYNNMFTINSVSAVTTTGTNPAINTFTAVVTNEDQILNDGGYEKFAIKTERWGIIPLELVSWDTGSNTITLRIDPVWQAATLGINHNPSASFETDIAAVTKLYANEWLRMFIGPAKVKGVHIENANAAHTLLWVELFFANSNTASLEDIFYNNRIDAGQSSDGEPAIAAYYIQNVTPHILMDANGSKAYVRNVSIGAGAGRQQINIWGGLQKNSQVVTLQHCDNLVPVIYSSGGSFGSAFRVESDVNLYMSGQVGSSSREWDLTRYGTGHSSWLDKYPHPASVPAIDEATLAAWKAGTACINGDFPLMMGEGQSYKLQSTATLADIVNIKSNHRFLTAGANLTRDWAYKGGSIWLYVSSVANLRAGQVIVLDNGVSGDVAYIIVGVWLTADAFPGLLFIAQIGGAGGAGVAGTEYTGSTIKQQLPNVTYEVIGQTNFSTPVTGFTMTLDNRDTKVILKPAGTLATGTITMAPTPRDRQVVEIRSSQTVTTLTISPNSGQSVAGAPTTIPAGGMISAYFRSADTTWYF